MPFRDGEQTRNARDGVPYSSFEVSQTLTPTPFEVTPDSQFSIRASRSSYRSSIEHRRSVIPAAIAAGTHNWPLLPRFRVRHTPDVLAVLGKSPLQGWSVFQSRDGERPVSTGWYFGKPEG